MAFWSSERFKEIGSARNLIRPEFDPKRVKHGAYELALGPQAFITSHESKVTQDLELGDRVIIPPGQFGLLLTEESVHIPDDAIGFISIRFGIKRRGLVNVSGFHVDPGFSGKLKFYVYNAGPQEIRLSRGDRCFLIWFSDLDHKTLDLYDGDKTGQDSITAEDEMLLQGQVASPAALKIEIDELRRDFNAIDKRFSTWKTIGLIILGSIISLFGRFVYDSIITVDKQPSQVPAIEKSQPLEKIEENEKVTSMPQQKDKATSTSESSDKKKDTK